jgi:hypothetical protein
MLIYKIEEGLIDDDILHARRTLKVHTTDGPIACKLYDSGKFYYFRSAFGEVPYYEMEMPSELQAKIKEHLSNPK